MKQDIQNQIEFTEQLNDFQAAMEDDLNQRCCDFSAKWEFDLDEKLPINHNKPTLHKTVSWEPVNDEHQKNQSGDSLFEANSTLRPARQILMKPKMNISNLMTEKHRISILSGSFSQQRPSIFTDSLNRKSTDGDSMFGSIVESTGKISIVDHFSQSFEYRTSLVRNMQKPKVRQAEVQEEQIREQSEGGGSSSLNDRCSSMVDDGPSNAIVIKYLAITASQSRSENKREEPVITEEFKDSVDGHRSGKKGRLMPIKSFIQPGSEEDSQDPFKEGRESRVVTMTNQEAEGDEEEEECNAVDDIEEYSTQKIPVGHTRSPNSKASAAFGPPNFK